MQATGRLDYGNFLALEKELRPLGYKVQVRVLSFPGGMIGEIGLFLRW